MVRESGVVTKKVRVGLAVTESNIPLPSVSHEYCIKVPVEVLMYETGWLE